MGRHRSLMPGTAGRGVAALEGRTDAVGHRSGIGSLEMNIHTVVDPCGGIAPRVRRRSRLALSLAEREEISRGLCERRSIRVIAKGLGRAPSSISREIARNSDEWWRYRAHAADKRAWKQALRPKRCHLAENPLLAQLVAQKLKMDWSPQQISGWLKREFGDDRSMRVSHETIYRSLFIQARGVLKKELHRASAARPHVASQPALQRIQGSRTRARS